MFKAIRGVGIFGKCITDEILGNTSGMTTVGGEMTHVGDGELLVSFSFRKADVAMHVYFIASLVSSPAARPSTPHFEYS